MRVYYGWVLTAVAALAVSVSFGPVIVFTFGVFLLPVTEELGWSRGEASLAFTIAALTVSLVSPLIGKITDRLGPRPVVAVCATVYAAAFASLSLLTGSLAQLYGTYFAIGLVGNGATQLPYARTITEWFDKRRGLALSLMMTGVGAGIAAAPWAAQRLIDGYGWREAYRILGLVIFLVAVPLPTLLLRRGRGVKHAGGSGAGPDGSTVRQALGGATFWMIIAGFALQSAALNGCVAHLAPLLNDRGIAAQQAAVAASTLGVFTVAGRLMTGWLLDRLHAPRVAAAFFGLAALGVAALLLPVTPAIAYVSAALIGLSMGAEADAMPYLISRYFGLRSFTELYGYAFSAYAVAGALGPGVMGLGFDRFGDYRAVIVALATLAVMAAAPLLALRRAVEHPATAAA